jgi:hypothetical protein
MARLQILELPTVERPDGTEETPFVLVVDQHEYQRYILGADQEAPASEWEGVAEKIGARQVLVFNETIEIPANEVPVDPDGYPLKIRVEPDFEQFREQVQDEIRKAQAELADALNRETQR